jgi:hypothetical protein
VTAVAAGTHTALRHTIIKARAGTAYLTGVPARVSTAAPTHVRGAACDASATLPLVRDARYSQRRTPCRDGARECEQHARERLYDFSGASLSTTTRLLLCRDARCVVSSARRDVACDYCVCTSTRVRLRAVV